MFWFFKYRYTLSFLAYYTCPPPSLCKVMILINTQAFMWAFKVLCDWPPCNKDNWSLFRLKDVLLDTASAGSTSDVMMSGVEKCTCPRGYSGLSCEVSQCGFYMIYSYYLSYSSWFRKLRPSVAALIEHEILVILLKEKKKKFHFSVSCLSKFLVLILLKCKGEPI